MLCLISHCTCPHRARTRFRVPTTLIPTSSLSLEGKQETNTGKLPTPNHSNMTTITNTITHKRLDNTASHVRRCHTIERRLGFYRPRNLTSG
jgi:hypothetical protein